MFVLCIELLLFLTVLGLRCCSRFSPVAASWGAALQLQVHGFSLRWLPLLCTRALESEGFRSWACEVTSRGSRALEHRLSKLWRVGLVAPQHVASSQIRGQTCVSCIGKVDSLPLSHQGSPSCFVFFFFLNIVQISFNIRFPVKLEVFCSSPDMRWWAAGGKHSSEKWQVAQGWRRGQEALKAKPCVWSDVQQLCVLRAPERLFLLMPHSRKGYSLFCLRKSRNV